MAAGLPRLDAVSVEKFLQVPRIDHDSAPEAEVRQAALPQPAPQRKRRDTGDQEMSRSVLNLRTE